MTIRRPEPLRGKHRLEGFECGEDALNAWLTRYAGHAEAAGSARVFVTADDDAQVAGYYALTAGEVRAADATVRLLKGQPPGRSVPVLILARLAIDRRLQGRGVGRSLLQDALLRCSNVAESVGVRAIVVNAIGSGARAFYERFGFESSPTDPLQLILLMKDLRRFLSEAE